MPFGTLRSSDCIREFKRLIATASMIVMILALTGCGFLPFGDKTNTNTPPPVAQTSSDSESSSPDGYKQVPAPAPPIVTPMDPVIAAGALQLGTEGSMGSLGLNLEEYFDKNADEPTRIKRVERAVTAIQNDLKTLMPPIQRLITVERDIQELVAQLAEFIQAPPPPPAAITPRVTKVSSHAAKSPQSLHQSPAGAIHAPTPKTTHYSSPASNNRISGGYKNPAAKGGATIKSLRIGEHKTKTRIVLDASNPASYHYDLDNGENLLVIDLPGTSWSGKKQWKSSKSPLLSSYNVYPIDGGGSRVVIQLKKGTSIGYETVLKANGNKNYRIVLDLKK